VEITSDEDYSDYTLLITQSSPDAGIQDYVWTQSDDYIAL